MAARERKITKTEWMARKAIDGMTDNELWYVGEYRTNQAGASTRVTAASEWCGFNDLEDSGDTVKQFLDRETGVLVIVPEQDD